MSGQRDKPQAVGFPVDNPFAFQQPMGMLAANDGVSIQTKANLARMGLLPDDPYQAPDMRPSPAPLGQDPTRQVTQQEYDRLLKIRKQQMEQRYLQYKQKR